MVWTLFVDHFSEHSAEIRGRSLILIERKMCQVGTLQIKQMDTF